MAMFRSDKQRRAMFANMNKFSEISNRIRFAVGDDLDSIYDIYKKLRKREDERKWITDSHKRGGSSNSIIHLEGKYLDLTRNLIPKLTDEELHELDRYYEDRYKEEPVEFSKKKLYHGSAGFGGRVIEATGLIPASQQGRINRGYGQYSDPDYVYLTSDREVAKTFADQSARHFGDDKYGPVVYEVEVEEDELEPDMGFPSSFKHRGIISKDAVKKVKFSKNPKKFLMPDYIENPKDYAPVKVNVQKFKEYWERNPDNYFEKDSVALEDRYEGVAEEVKKSKEIYMPEVYAKPGPEPSLDTIDVADGRHRSAAFIEHGIKEMKIVVPDFQKKWFEDKMGAS